MIRFLFGADGGDKKKQILDMLREDAKLGTPSMLIVPEQEAVQAERLTLTHLPASAQLTLEVLNFSRLYNRVCREYGGLSYSYVTKPMQHLLMWKALKEISPLLGEYSYNAQSDPSFADDMLAMVLELKTSAVTPEQLEEAAQACEEHHSALSQKLRDIALICGTYDLLVSEKYSDSADDLAKLCDVLDEHDFFKGKNVYIDSFTSFTAIEHRVIEKIFRSADNTVISIPLPSPTYSDISTVSINRSYSTLRKNASKWGEPSNIILAKDGQDITPIEYLSQNLWKLGEVVSEEDRPSARGTVVMESCDTSYSEVEATVAHILELLRGGARCRDIAVVMRNADKYAGIVEPEFERANIPFFFSEKSDMCSLAPVKFILTAIKIRQYNWRKSDVISHIKTGLCNFGIRESDIFEEYINTWNISGSRFNDGEWTMNPDGFSDRLTERGKMILATANTVREALCEPLNEFFLLLDAADTVPDMCRAVFSYAERIGLREKCAQLAARELEYGSKKAAAELAGVYDVMLSALADIGEALSDTRASIDDFYTIVKTVFDNTRIGTIPTSVDEVVIGSASMLRFSEPKYVFVLGLCDGEFPATVESTGILSENDRTLLSEIDLELGADSDSRSSDELMFVKNAFSAPRERLYLLCSTSDLKGAKRTPSLPFRRVKNMFSDITVHTFKGNDLSYASGSPRSTAAHLRNISNQADKQAAVLAVSEHIPDVARLCDASVSTLDCRVSPETVRAVVGDKIFVSPSSLEKYARCPFSYYASYLLSLRETKYGRFGANHIGNFIHYIMEHAVRFAVPADPDLPFPSPEEIRDEVLRIIEQYIRMIAPDQALNTKRMEHLYSKLCKLSLLILDGVIKEFSDSDFRPAFFELRIDGRDSNPAPIELSLKNGARLILRGFVDRVDVWKDNGEVYIRIVDYKTGSKQFSLSDLDYGINTQMLLYLFAICSSPSKKMEISDGKLPIPAGVVYLSSAISQTKLSGFEVSEQEILMQASENLSRSGILLSDERVLYAMSHSASKQILMGVTQKDGEFVGSCLVSGEEFSDIYDKIKQILVEIGDKIYDGIADCSPLELGGQDPCKYCTVKQMCRKSDF